MLVYGVGGWVRVDTDEVPGLPGPLYFRVGSPRGVVTEIYLPAEPGREVTAGHLRRIPLARLQTMANSRPDILGGMIGDGLYPADQDPDIVGRIDRLFPQKRRRPDVDSAATLSPPAAGLDDDFLRQVASAYTAAVARGERPNRALAEQVGHDKTRTVERWVYLSRKRGFLPRGRPGAVG